MFMHASFLHIAGNMLFLWIFGNNVEDSMGPVKYIFFYLLGGMAALALQVAVDPSSTAPTVGASGAIAAVLGGYIVLYPRARVLTLVFIILFFTVIELPAWVMLGLWFVQQAVFGAVGLTNPTGGGGGVAYFAHIGGFAFGGLAIRAAGHEAQALTAAASRLLIACASSSSRSPSCSSLPCGVGTVLDIQRNGVTVISVIAVAGVCGDHDRGRRAPSAPGRRK